MLKIKPRRGLGVLASTMTVFVLYFPAALAQDAVSHQLGEQTDKLAPFVPTPLNVVEEMLKFAKVDEYDRVYDLGSGDGRIVIMAAQKFKAEAVGVEMDDTLYKQSMDRIAELGLSKRAKILHENMYKVSLKPATVITLYLLTSVNERLRPILERDLRPGVRVVTHDFKVPGWDFKDSKVVMSDTGISHTLYLYVRP
ncbi:MAG: cyclopropane-fatty-acyl-phospholipid synthase family protein [Terriglobia bacterium]